MIYFLDTNMKVIRANTPLENFQTSELPEDQSLMKNYVELTIKSDETINQTARYVAMSAVYGNSQSYEMFEITSKEDSEKTLSMRAIDIGPREMSGYIVKDRRPRNWTVTRVITELLSETDWSIGYVSDKLPTVSTSFFYLTLKDALTKLQQVAGCEIIFRVEIVDGEISDKWIEVHDQLGSRRAHRFEYGTGLLQITRQSSTADLYTALIGRGKGEEVGDGYGRKIDFSDVVRENKPAGQDYIENPLATALYGINALTGMRPRIGIVEFDTEDPEELLDLTMEQLEYTSRPKTEFKTKISKIGKASIGDTSTMHKYEIGLHYETRIRKIVRDRLNDENTQVTLGDYVHSPSTKQQARINKAIQKVEGDQQVIKEQVSYAIKTADGMNTITYSDQEPERKRVGDLWYRTDPTDSTRKQMVIWSGTLWEETDRSAKLESDIKAAIKDIEDVRETANEASAQISGAIEGTGSLNLAELIASKVSDEEASTLFYQEAKNIGLAYEENGVIKAMIGIVDGQIYQRGDKILLDGDEIIANGTLTVTEEMFAKGITFDWAKGKTFDAQSINVINLNMDHISGGSIDLAKGITIDDGSGTPVLAMDSDGNVEMNISQMVINSRNLEEELDDKATKAELKDIELTEGPSGKTAYEIAVENGFEGTEQEWINSLVGDKGENGKTTYTWVRYADDEKGNGMSQYPEGKRYVGMAFNKTTAKESNSASAYKWSPLYDNVEVGGRNLFPVSDFREWGGGYEREGHTFNVSQSASASGSGIRLPNDAIKPNTEYILSFKTKKISGSVTTMAGHTGSISTRNFYMDGERVSDAYSATYPDDEGEHHFALHFISRGSIEDYIYIQPNRSHYDFAYEMEIWDIQLEKGNISTDWTPAPEDVDDKINNKADQENVTDLEEDVSDFETIVGSQGQDIVSLSETLTNYKELIDSNQISSEQAVEEINRLMDPDDGRLVAIDNRLGEFAEQWTFLETQITFGEEGIFIGQGNTGIRVGNDRIDFVDGSDVPVAYITGQVMRINRGIFVDSAQIGEHKIETVGDGHTIFTWVTG